VIRLHAGYPRNYGSVPDRNKKRVSSEVLDRLRVWGSLLFSGYYTAGRSRYSSVGIAIRYGLDGPGIESRWVPKFSALVQNGPEAHPASCTMGTGSFPGVKRTGCGVDHPPTSSFDVKERVELYLYSPYGPLWPVLGWTLPLHLLYYTAGKAAGARSW
jgi:hypothetical protein